ncbi:CHAT domain-containing protein [Larkinella bovis]|uniref:CHAT domain-containing protein n=1 Tax=Larkinella bovis TaxID=683041 RepID=A0ABW0I4I7_9BACT
MPFNKSPSVASEQFFILLSSLPFAQQGTMEKPVVFIASANPSSVIDAPYLSEVKDEIRYIDELFSELEFANKIMYPSPSLETDADTIHKAFVKFSQELAIFHYSGHASQSNFTLTDGQYNRDQLLKLLSGKKPKLVFLNGCSTYGYVNALLEHGVEAVIATSTAVNDGRASEFAKKFYFSFTRSRKTLRQAFDEAVSSSSTLSAKQSLFLRGGFSTQIPDQPCAWGLYYANPDILNWDLLNELATAVRPSAIDRQKAYLCDRDGYLSRFYPSFDLDYRPDNLRRSVQHFLLVGEDSQSPLGLARKLVYEKITKAPERRYTYPFNPNNRQRVTDDMIAKLNRVHCEPLRIAREVYKVVKGENADTDLSFDSFLALPDVRRSDYTIVALQIHSDDLDEKVVRSIKQFISTFRPAQTAPPAEPPYLLFFWNIIYAPKKARLWDFFGGNPVRKLLEPFKAPGFFDPDDLENSPLVILNRGDELLTVPDGEKDIRNWFQNYLSVNSYSDNDFQDVKQVVPVDKNEKLDVPTLETRLLRLIERINNQPD